MSNYSKVTNPSKYARLCLVSEALDDAAQYHYSLYLIHGSSHELRLYQQLENMRLRVLGMLMREINKPEWLAQSNSDFVREVSQFG